MGVRTCPRCGANDRSHEVVAIGREHGGSRDHNSGIRVCTTCMSELMTEITELFAAARKGVVGAIDANVLEEAQEEREEDERAHDRPTEA